MHPSALSAARPPYGLAFKIEDLVLLRGWAEQRRLGLSIVLDRISDGAEFEELLVVGPVGGRRPTLTLWRTVEAVFAQTPSGTPHSFPTMQELLDQVRPVRPRRAAWLQRLGLGA